MSGLSRYNEKRRFDATPEPSGAVARSPHAKANGGLFVIQKHHARRLHYDVRLELDGVLVSWAVPKGPSLDPKDRRLAVHVEDHPLDYADFEGVIPEGNYGAGEVIVWDRGTWEWTPTPGKPHQRDAKTSIARGKLDFTVASEKLAGRFVLVRSGRDEKSWMLIKVKDGAARPGSDIEAERPESVLTGRRVEELGGAAGEHQWSSQAGLVVPEARALPDLGALLGRDAAAVRASTKWFDAIATDEPPPFLEATPVTKLAATKRGRWLGEIEHQGARALLVRRGEAARLLDASGADLAPRFPEVARAVARLPGDAALDAVLCVVDAGGRSSRALLEPRLAAADPRTIERLARERPAVAFAFDLLQLAASDLRAVPLEGRKRALEALLPRDDDRLRYLSHVAAPAEDFLAVACENGLEGVVMKKARSKYVAGPQKSWLAVRCPEKARRPG